MRSLLALVSFARLAHAEPEVELRVTSTGREVPVDLYEDDARRSCVTPCVLRVSPGSYRARVDGLDRTLVAGEGDTEVIVTPTQRGRQIVGIVLATLGAAGITFAGHWASPLDDRQRITSGLAGVALMSISLPFIGSSSARIGKTGHPSRADVFAGIHRVDGTQSRLALGVGFRPRVRGLGAQLRVRLSNESDIYQLALGPTLHGPQLVGIRPAIAVHAGLSSQRGPEIPADLAAERPAMPGSIELRALLELEARLELAALGMLQPSIGGTMQTLPDRQYALDVGVHVRF